MRYANRQDSILRLPLSDFELAKSETLEWQCVTVPYDGQPSVRFSYQKQFYRLDADEWPPDLNSPDSQQQATLS